VGVHSFTLSYTLGNMKCDSQASFLDCTFASPYFGHEPKARVVTMAAKYLFSKISRGSVGNGQKGIYNCICLYINV
jgi:hypothetical protein